MSDAVCVHCRKPCVARFEITRFDSSGADKGTVVCCSVVHLIHWAYEFSALTGVRAAYKAKSFVADLVNSLKGKS